MALNAPTVGQMKPIELATVSMVNSVELVSILSFIPMKILF